jgi:hypothetical protein
LSTTDDAPPAAAGWHRLAFATTAIACLGFGAGYGVGALRAPAAASPTAIAGVAMTEANLAGATADLALRVDRLAGAERSFVAWRGQIVGTEALMRAGLTLREAMLADGSYAAPLDAVLALPGGADALAALEPALQAGAAGAPSREVLAVQLDALAGSVLALEQAEEQAGWTRRMMRRMSGYLSGRTALQGRRSDAFAAARDAAALGDLPASIVALESLDAEAASVLSGWVDAARRRMALDSMADRVAASMVTYAYR